MTSPSLWAFILRIGQFAAIANLVLLPVLITGVIRQLQAPATADTTIVYNNIPFNTSSSVYSVGDTIIVFLQRDVETHGTITTNIYLESPVRPRIGPITKQEDDIHAGKTARWTEAGQVPPGTPPGLYLLNAEVTFVDAQGMHQSLWSSASFQIR